MERKKRRRSIRNLRRQSISSCGETENISAIEDSILQSNGEPTLDSSVVFGTIWMETNEESLKEKRKKRRSSMLLQKPVISFDTTSPEIETMREDCSNVRKSPYQVTVSPDLVKLLGDKQPSPLVTPNQSYSNLDMAFVSELTTPVLSELNSSATPTNRKVYPVTPEDILSDSPLISTSPFVTPVTSHKNEGYNNSGTATPSNSWKLNENVSPNCIISSNSNTPSFDISETTDYEINLSNEVKLDDSCENTSAKKQLDQTLSASKLVKPDSFHNSQCEGANPSPSCQLDNLTIDTPNRGGPLTPISDEGCQNMNVAITPRQIIDDTNFDQDQSYGGESSENTYPSSTILADSANGILSVTAKEEDPDVQRTISPTGLVESLDNIASGAMGLFNTLVRKISIKRGKNQKKTPKRLKQDKNCESHACRNLENDEGPGIEDIAEVEEDELKENVDLKEKQPMDVDDKLNVLDSCEGNLLSEITDRVTDNNVDMTECDIVDSFNMTSLVESIDSQKENGIKSRARSRRRSAEYFITTEANKSVLENVDDTKQTEDPNVRKSKRTRRKSLDIYQAGQAFEEESVQKFFISKFVKYTRPKKQATENLEDLYQNKNYKAPLEKTWETIYESPGKSKQPGQLVSKKKFRRVVDFNAYAPARYKRRLQKASNNGWDVTGKKKKNLADDYVLNKLSEIYNYLDSPLET